MPQYTAKKSILSPMKFRPCIDIHNGKVKQIVGSSLSDTSTSGLITNFETDLSPSHFATMYKQDNLFGGHIIMLGPQNEAATMEALIAFPQGFHVGGGITPDNALHFIKSGASHVIVTSYVFKDGKINWENLDKLVSCVGTSKLVLDLSCTKQDSDYLVATDRWQKVTSVKISQGTLAKLSSYCDEFLIHAAHMEGKRRGVDEDLIALLSNTSPIPVTYAGGVRHLDDLDIVDRVGQGRVDATVGSALDIFGGTLAYRSVVEWNKNHTHRKI